jgi:FlaA1/EpsC-like NDP-sugar epimerase
LIHKTFRKFWQSTTPVLMDIGDRITHLPRNIRQALLLALDTLFIPLSITCATMLARNGRSIDYETRELVIIGVTMVLSAIIFMRLGLYRAIIRFMGHKASLAIMRGVTWSALIFGWLSWSFETKIPESAVFIYWCLTFAFIGGSRFVVRMIYHRRLKGNSDNVIIYGAGVSGRNLLSALQFTREFEPVFFVDDDPALHGVVIHGISVVSPAELPTIVAEYSISQILLAMPSVDRVRRREIVARLEGLPVHVRTVPALVDLVAGRSAVSQIREIEIEDLLGREPVPPDVSLLQRCVAGKTVMVTGAGGSIGSELCRQILRQKPHCLLLVELSEFALYQIEQQLRALMKEEQLECELVPLLGSVQDARRLALIFQSYPVDTVYHAAAYKHVPIVEYNSLEGVKNNAIGTWVLAREAERAGVKTFVLISTDKAVRPSSVMGASKRFAELVLQALAAAGSKTCFCMVRFGNVLGSSGSVVPLFREQINAGGPVTVTHPEVIRYFMTLTEAAQLVIQASALAKGGDLFVLDMGEPVRILDLARRMIRLMGHQVRDETNPFGDIEITLTGLRCGEKLFEELLLGSNVTATEHPMILRAEEEFISLQRLEILLERLNRAMDAYDCEQVGRLLHDVVNSYSKHTINDCIWVRGIRQSPAAPARVQNLYPSTGLVASDPVKE